MNVPIIDIQQTGANIKALRKAAGIKVKDVADTLGVSTQAVAKWQAGTALPTIDNLVILAAIRRLMTSLSSHKPSPQDCGYMAE